MSRPVTGVSRDMITVSEASRQFAIDRGQLYRWMRQGRLSYIKAEAGNRLLDPAEVERVVAQRPSPIAVEPQIDSGADSLLIEAFKAQIAELPQDKADLRQRLDRAEQRLAAADQERATMLRMIEDKRSWWRRWFEG